MTSKTQAGPTFNALDGTELIDVIIGEIREKLEATGEFKPHRTFPLIKLTFSVGVATYPTQNLEDPPRTTAKAEVTLPKGAEVPEVEPDKPFVEVTDTQVIDTPDKARRKAKIPLKVPAPGPDKVLFDKPIPPKVKEPTPGV